MRNFANLVRSLEESQSHKAKKEALILYFLNASDKDKLWCISLLTSKRPKRLFTSQKLRNWVKLFAEIPDWLFEESLESVGELVETISIILPNTKAEREFELNIWIDKIKNLREISPFEQEQLVTKYWQELQKDERLVFNKLLTGSFRTKVSQKILAQALGNNLAKDPTEISHRITKAWQPESTTFSELIYSNDDEVALSKPYPFSLAHYLETDFSSVGKLEEWAAEWKWDGIRAQLIYREDQLYVWSRANELVTEKFPELKTLSADLPSGTVIDGEILAFKDGRPLSYLSLQTRYNRKNIQKKLLEEIPVIFMAYDILEHENKDIRQSSYRERRKLLEEIVQQSNNEFLLYSEEIQLNDWQELELKKEEIRSIGAEGFMLKQNKSKYFEGRTKGKWWKTKNDPMTIDAILLYATRGQGIMAGKFSEFTFALWSGEDLIPFTKATGEFTEDEHAELKSFVKENFIERFGPVISVRAELVFEIAFDSIDESKRHKSGIVLRNPRIIRWRKDKPMEEADSLINLKNLL